MLIQCQSCATKYRLDPERIPRRKTFVRCKSCGTPIYVDPTEEGGEDAQSPLTGLIPPTPSLSAHGAATGLAPVTESGPPSFLRAEYDPDSVPVRCPQCQSRYRVPTAPLRRPNIKLKCSVCGHIFAPAQGVIGAQGENSGEEPLFAGATGPSRTGTLSESAIERVQNLAGSDPFATPESEANPEQAYLEAVALDQDEGGARAGKVPEDQKYRLFLRPDQFRPERADQESVMPEEAAADLHEEDRSSRLFRSEPPAPSAARGEAPWASSGGDDSILEIEFFDDEEAALAGAVKAETLQAEERESLKPGPAATHEEELVRAEPDAPIDLPELDDDLGDLEPLDSHQAADETARDMMDFSPAEAEASVREPLIQESNPDLTALKVDSTPTDRAENEAEELPDLTELDGESTLEPLPDLDEEIQLEATGTSEPTQAESDGFDLSALPEDAFKDPVLPAESAMGGASLPPQVGELPPLPPLPGEEAALTFDDLPLPASEPVAPPAAPAPAKEAPKEPPRRQVIPGQEGWFTDKRRVLVLVVLAGVIVGGLLGWGGWLMREKEPERPFALETGQVHQLSLQENLEGRTVVHRGGKHLFVVEGQLVNRFPRSVKISWVRVRGTIYADHTQKQLLGQTQAYLGNVLTDTQLETWDLDAITAYGAYNNGRNNANFEIPPGSRVPYQLVFVGVRVPVLRTVAQVISYSRDGLAVYVDDASKK